MKYSCVICKSAVYYERAAFTKRIGADGSKFKIVKCAKCGLHSLNPLPTDEELMEIYGDYSFKGDRQVVEINRIETIYPRKIRTFRKYNQEIQSILDIGAGLGGFVCTAIKSGINRVVGIEMEKEQTELAHRIFNVNLNNTTFEEYIKSNKDKYDAVHMHHVLEHMKNPFSTLVQINRLLNPTGILLFEVPNQFFVFPTEIYIRLGLIKSLKPYNPFHHLYFFSPNVIKKIVKQAGYEILELNVFENERKNLKKQFKRFIAKIFYLPTSNIIEVVCKKNRSPSHLK